MHGNFYWNAALLDIGKMVHVQMFPTSILNGGSETINLPTISFCGYEQKTRLFTNPPRYVSKFVLFEGCKSEYRVVG